jgi:hypothetical protein
LYIRFKVILKTFDPVFGKGSPATNQQKRNANNQFYRVDQKLKGPIEFSRTFRMNFIFTQSNEKGIKEND